MTATVDSCLIILTYKGKILLLQQDDVLNNLPHNDWHFIERIKEKNKTPQETIMREVKRQTEVKLSEVSFVARISRNGNMTYLFHARLNDNNVDNLKRDEGKLLQFFTLQELKRLRLKESTKLFLPEYSAIIENTLLN